MISNASEATPESSPRRPWRTRRALPNKSRSGDDFLGMSLFRPKNGAQAHTSRGSGRTTRLWQSTLASVSFGWTRQELPSRNAEEPLDDRPLAGPGRKQVELH